MINRIIHRCLAPALLATCLVSSHYSPASAAAFIKFDGVDGESQDTTHQGAIDVLSWSWGATNSGTHAGGGGGGAGKVSMSDLTVTKELDKSSPRLMLACARGEHIREAVLILRSQAEEPVEYLKITLSDLLVTSYSVAGTGSSGGDRPMESLSLNFSRIEIEYIPVDADGAPQEPVRASWDLVENTAQ
jgi:type VI secretion system secreted protein Hcp